ncbi:hypothetical protein AARONPHADGERS_64 [Bacillus phage AaronPhadgers]|nr:hypothetical protein AARONPHADGERS_64 [Bacillus phage AaronPhadgers]AXF42018.1 hypothetical protein [Bacillus phage Saddex]
MEQVRFIITGLLLLYTFIRWDSHRDPFLSGGAVISLYERWSLQCWVLGHWWFLIKKEYGTFSTHETYFCPVCGKKYLYHR